MLTLGGKKCQLVPPPRLGPPLWRGGTIPHHRFLCPRSWSVGNWSTCSRTCGGGTQSRPVQCMRRAHYKSERVPASLCPKPMPSSRQTCHTQSCPPAWSTGPWAEVTGQGWRGVAGPLLHGRAGVSLGLGGQHLAPQHGLPHSSWELTPLLPCSAREPAERGGGSGPWPVRAPTPRPGRSCCPTLSAPRSPSPEPMRPVCSSAATSTGSCSGLCPPGPR